jgi:hypothetical protein
LAVVFEVGGRRGWLVGLDKTAHVSN